MALFDFVKDAGEKLFGIFKGSTEEMDRTAAEKLNHAISTLGFKGEGLNVAYTNGIATVTGRAATQEEKEKILLTVGNTQGVAKVDDQLQVEKNEPQAAFYTVKSGDTLSKISKQFYGNANRYTVIFEANKPMLKDPNKIYPGQTLRIPPLH